MANKTVTQLKTGFDTDIRNEATPKAITKVKVADNLNLIADELQRRGLLVSADTTGLASLDPVDGQLAIVPGVGIFKTLVTVSAADGLTTFASTTAGTLWQLYSRLGVVKKYVATLTQSSTSAPVATVLGLNSVGVIVWARSAQGVYTGTLSAAFTAAKTVLKVFNNVAKDNTYNLLRTSANVITLTSASNAAGTITANDALLTDTVVEIEVYP